MNGDGDSTDDPWDPILAAYIEAQGELLAPLRAREMPAHPWPDSDDPMLAYLLNHALAVAESDGTRKAIAWLGAHAWLEGALADRAHVLRVVTS